MSVKTRETTKKCNCGLGIKEIFKHYNTSPTSKAFVRIILGYVPVNHIAYYCEDCDLQY